MNWIRPEKRLAIYLRDGMACVYCGAAVEKDEGVKLSLDHVRPYCKGGTNDASNLVTACFECNSKRGAKSLVEFCKNIAGENADKIMRHVRNCKRRRIDVAAAKAIMALRMSM